MDDVLLECIGLSVETYLSGEEESVPVIDIRDLPRKVPFNIGGLQ